MLVYYLSSSFLLPNAHIINIRIHSGKYTFIPYHITFSSSTNSQHKCSSVYNRCYIIFPSLYKEKLMNYDLIDKISKSISATPLKYCPLFRIP